MPKLEQFLFNRCWAVTIGDGKKGDQNAKRFSELRTQFEVHKGSQGDSCKSKISITNMSSDSRMSVQRKGLVVRLDVGYEGLFETLFIGDVAPLNGVITHRKGADIVTTFELADGERQLTNTHFDKSYAGGTSLKTIFQDVATQLGIDVGTVIGIPDQTISNSRTFTGTCKNALITLCKNAGLEWSIQNNQLQIIPIKHHSGSTAIVLSKATGLIGVPAPKDSGFVFQALLNPRLVPGAFVQIISENVNGYFKIRSGKYEGDSHGDKWQVQCECTRVQAVQSFLQNRGLEFNTAVG